MNPPSLHTVWCGIDPGFEGAIGVIDHAGIYLAHYEIPTNAEAGRKREFDVSALAQTIKGIGFGSRRARVILEYPTTRPDESPESSKRFGVGLGLIEMGFTYAGYPPQRIAPATWKGALGLAGKATDPLAARQQAVSACLRLIPTTPPEALHGPRGGLRDGVAEALLIAWWGLTRTREGLQAQPPDVRLARVLFSGGRRRRKGGGPTL